jgi:UDPglucose 6-dehydrogenase
MDISIVGSGYVGLVTGVGLASKDHKVVCIDIDQDRVNLINRGQSPFYDDTLPEALDLQVNKTGNLKASTDYRHVSASDVTFICVSTSRNNGSNTDFTAIEASAKGVGEALRTRQDYHLVVTKSSVPPGATELIIRPLLQEHSGKQAGAHFGMAVNPEFLQEGRALESFLNSDRIVVGQQDERSGDCLQQVYSGFDAPVVRTDMRTAEMIKFASNAFLATKISFINEVGNLCKEIGVDVYDVAKAMGYDRRIGRSFLNAGVGFGGSCLPKDLETLIHKYQEKGMPSPLLHAVHQVNKRQPQRLVAIVQSQLGDLRGKTLAVLGLAFKPNTDDVRHAPSLEVIDRLLAEGASVVAYDPKAMPATQREVQHERLSYGSSVIDCVSKCGCILILTEWDEFRDEGLYTGKIVIDGRRALDPVKAALVCQHYEGVCW